MYRILIADDEGIVLEALKIILEKQFGNKVELQFAKTGRNAIELAENFKPHIAIMDINMPGINGIDAIKEIKKSTPDTRFIVLSAFDKFDYAKEAINLGVEVYLNKPIVKSEIIDVIQKAMIFIDKEKKKRQEELLIREKMETVVPIIENGFIYNLMFKEFFKEDIEHYKNLLSVNEKYGYIMVLICGDEQDGNHMTNAVGSSVKLQCNFNNVREMIKQYFSCIIGNIVGNKIIILVLQQEENLTYHERIEIINKGRELTQKLNKLMDAQFRLGIGSTKKINDINNSYSQALSVLIATTLRVAHSQDVYMNVDNKNVQNNKLEQELLTYMRKGNVERAVRTAREFFEWLEEKVSDIHKIKIKILENLTVIEYVFKEEGLPLNKIIGDQDKYLFSQSINSMPDVKNWFMERIVIVSEDIRERLKATSVGIIMKAKEFINENYSKDISLDEVSKTVNISPYYFSKLFKEEEGETFIEFLTKKRINAAKKMLDTTNSSIKQICSEVGYSDPNYFSRAFKKNTGYTPTEYKEGKFEHKN